MKLFILIFILILMSDNVLSDDYIRVNIKVKTHAGESNNNLYIGVHPNATFHADEELGQLELPPFPPPGSLHAVFIWKDTSETDYIENIQSKEVYYPIPNKNKYYYRYHLYVTKDDVYDTLTVSWGDIPEYIDSIFFADHDAVVFKVDMKKNQEYVLDGYNIFIDNFYFDVYYSEYPSSVLNNTDADDFVFYPNPVENILHFDSVYEEINIYDLSGRVIISGQNSGFINVSSLNTGVYILNVMKGNILTSKRFIKI